MVSIPFDANLKQALSAGTPVEVQDAATSEIYYLLSAEQFQQLTLHTDFDPRAAYPLIDTIMAADDQRDPLLDSYQ
jgi:hypothetical protein